MKLRIASLAIGLLVVATPLRGASLTFEFASSLLNALPGQTVLFSGSVTNTGTTPAFINGDSFTFPLPVNDLPFLTNFPATLPPAGSFTGQVLQVTVPLLTPPGLYTGVFNVLGGDAPSQFNVLSSRDFAVQVQTLPEPTTFMLSLSGILAVAFIRFRILKGRLPLSPGGRKTAFMTRQTFCR